MRMHIDFSLMSETEAFGYMDGDIELPFVPRAGDHISFGRGKIPPLPWVKGMVSLVKVESAILQPNSEEISLSVVMLSS